MSLRRLHLSQEFARKTETHRRTWKSNSFAYNCKDP